MIPHDPAVIEGLMAKHHLPGLSMATVMDGAPPTCTVFGCRDVRSGEAVTAATVFEAASLTKPVFAYLALMLDQRGLLPLDRPLAEIVPGYLGSDPGVTARHILAHTSGLPNWRSQEYPLRCYFPPGRRFSYSGEGYVYLQAAIERLCGETLDRIAAREIFAPLAMTVSSLVWHDGFNSNPASPHTASGASFDDGFAGKRFATANAACSLYTTASDYARFLQAAMASPFLATWLTPQAPVLRDSLTNLDPATEPATRSDIAWGLGWGIELQTGRAFHWGDQKGFKAFAMAAPDTGNAAVVLTNGDAGLSFLSRLLEPVCPGPCPSVNWLGYEG
jgi:CubicO group peptidase (beta-lactamase class C family)